MAVFDRTRSKGNDKPTLTCHFGERIYTIGKNRFGGVYLSEYNRITRDSEFIDLNPYYGGKLQLNRKFNHCLKPALTYVVLQTMGTGKPLDEAYGSISEKEKMELNQYLNGG
jgi:hypothetical protein